MTTTASLVTYERTDQIAIITLNRPEKLNAFTDDVVRELAARMRQFDTDPEAFVAILRGAGRAFSGRRVRSGNCAAQGAPSGSAAVGQAPTPTIFDPHGELEAGDISRAWLRFGMAVNVAFDCDLVVAEAGTKFQITETSRGLGGARYWGLLDFIGAGAFGVEVALTGRVFTAEEALAANVLSRVAPAGEHVNVATELAKLIAKNPPLSVRSTVRTRRWYMAERARHTEMQQTALNLHLTEDFREAARAFVEKRPAGPFTGR